MLMDDAPISASLESPHPDPLPEGEGEKLKALTPSLRLKGRVEKRMSNRKRETGNAKPANRAQGNRPFPFLISGFLFLIPFGHGSDEQKQLSTIDY